jgi:NAD(P)-dependent dehydrogenase (short-subunit alcohol dehydrogenase family)
MIDKIYNIKKNIVIISGGAGYLGGQFSKTISSIGGIPLILDNNEKALKSLKKYFNKKKLKGYFFLIDLNNEIEVNNIISYVYKKFKKIDSLVNTAGYTGQAMLKNNDKFFQNFEDSKFKLWEDSLSGNLTSFFLMTRAVSKLMKKKNNGTIVNIASDAGIISPDHRIYQPDKKENYKGTKFNTPLSYSVAKSGIISMTRYLATYFAKNGIRVNCISPSGVFKNHDNKFVKKLSSRIPLGRMAKLHELDGALIFLCSNASSFVTGHNLVIDGGRTIW